MPSHKIIGPPASLDLKFLPTWGEYRRVTRRLVGRKRQLVMSFRAELRREAWLRGERELSAWDVREKFLKLPHDNLDGFLAWTGQFATRITYEPEYFWRWQSFLAEIMTMSPHKRQELLDGARNPDLLVFRSPWRVRLEWRSGAPHLVREARNTVEAIVASIQIELMACAEFRRCARADCGEIFRLESKHKRLYHSDECGHLELVRRSRQKKNKK